MTPESPAAGASLAWPLALGDATLTQVASIRVLIVDDHEIRAEGIRRLLEDATDVEVVGIARNLSNDESLQGLSLDVVILDDRALEAAGVRGVEDFTFRHPDAHIVVLANSDEDEHAATEAFRLGCSGFLGRSRSVDDFLGAIRAAYAGEILMTAAVFSRLMPPTGSVSSKGAGAVLSQREVEVLTVMAEGRTDKEIADRLTVSLHTVRKHTQNIIRKLGAHSKLEAVVLAVRKGVIAPL